MTQIVVTLDKDADKNFVKKMIDNMKGVLSTSFRNNTREDSKKKSDEEWIRKMKEFSDNFDSSAIDYDDPRTQYILSK